MSLKKKIEAVNKLHHVTETGDCAECIKPHPCPTAELVTALGTGTVIHDGDRDGSTFDSVFDADRLNKQSRVVYAAVEDGNWRTLAQIAALTGAPEASVSARLRDFRKEKFGGITVERRRVENVRGLHEYRVLTNQPTVDNTVENENLFAGMLDGKENTLANLNRQEQNG